LVTARSKGVGVVLREEKESRREEDKRTERSKGEEALTVAQTTWIHDAGFELKRLMRALATQGSRHGGRGRDERDEHENMRGGQETKS